MSFPKTLIDQMGRSVDLPAPPQRIVSLCPSLTETLVHMGLGGRLVGRTRFCIHPAEEMRRLPHVGGTKDVNMERLRALQPDLVIGEKEENTPEMAAAISAEFPLLMTDVVDLATADAMLALLGDATGLAAEAKAIADAVAASWGRVEALSPPVTCLYLIWKNPWMVVGANTFIDSVLEKCGFINLARGLQGRYPMLEEKDFLQLSPQIVLLSTEPFPFKESHVAELQEIASGGKAMLVDGEMFSWYGSHMVGVENYLNLLLRNAR